ncbi:DUF4097 family beta strand repeat protein [Fibrella sp. HMF5405]|uniref:DUF4097 family beta strand repeat protein n=2 Tax=Fibrella forsythiae TaxID=2817061 RepID=A0ABS3JDX1_9BACT|nr:DUF4097 family beta strand repeat protein [Fibrella forsythiae]
MLTMTAFSTEKATIQINSLDETPYKTQTFKGISALRSQTSGGSLLVEGGSGSEARVEMYVHSNNWNGKDELSKDEIEERLANYDIVIRQEGNTLVATAKQKNGNWNWKKGLSISFKFYTPRTITTNISTSGGSIKMSHLAGQQRFNTSGGSIQLADLKGDIEGNTSGGSIKLTDCHNQIDLETSGGSIDAANSDGTINLNTSGGSIRLTGLNGVIKAKTSGGSINGDGIDGELVTSTSGGSIRIRSMAGSIDAETSAGSVEVAMSRVDKFVKLETSAGSVRVNMPMNKGMDLDLSGNRVSAPLTNFNGSAEKDRIVGKMNGGGIPVRLTANSGSVYVNQN